MSGTETASPSKRKAEDTVDAPADKKCVRRCFALFASSRLSRVTRVKEDAAADANDADFNDGALAGSLCARVSADADCRGLEGERARCRATASR